MKRKSPIIIFAKPPHRGEVKTRLAQAPGDDVTVRLSEAFFDDTVALASKPTWGLPVIALSKPWAECHARYANIEVWHEASGDVQARLEEIFVRSINKRGPTLVIGTDTPEMPQDLLEEAHEGLSKFDAVIGPSSDGGFYLLGLKTCPTGLFSNLP